MNGTILQARDDIRLVLLETKPDLVSEFDENTRGGDDPSWVLGFLNRHFPGQPWATVEIKDTADLLRRISKTVEQRAVTAVVAAHHRNPHLFGGSR